MCDFTRAVSEREHRWYQADDGVVMCVHSSDRTKVNAPDSNVAPLCPHTTTSACSEEVLQNDSELDRVLCESRTCRGACGEVIKTIFGTNEHRPQEA